MDHPAPLRHIGDTGGFLQALLGFGVAGLVMLGVGGTIYRLVAPGGWLAEVFGRSVAGGMAATLALFMVGFSLWLTRAWISVRARNQYSELFVYSFAGLGLLYAVQPFMKGNL